MSLNYIELTTRKLSNILFHIEKNGDTIGDTNTLRDVHQSLKNMLKEHEELLNKKFN